MTNKSKAKGDNEERCVVNHFREKGFACDRTLEKGARSDGSQTWDIDLFNKGRENAPLIGECKIRKDDFKRLYEWKGENDFLTIRADRKERLYVISEDLFTQLVGGQS